MTQPTTTLTVDGQVVLTTEAGSVILTHDEAKVLAGRLGMDLSALKVRRQRGEYPFWVATREAYKAAEPVPGRKYYVSTNISASAVMQDATSREDALDYLHRLNTLGPSPAFNASYVVREADTGIIIAG